MWTATLTAFNKERGSTVHLEVEYTNGTDIHIRTYNLENPTKDKVRRLVRSEALGFDAVEAAALALTVGMSMDITPTPVITPDPPTAAELAQRAWFDDWQQLKQLEELTTSVPALATAQATALMATLRTSLEADWLNSYLGNI